MGSSTVQAVERAFEILYCFTPDSPELGVTEISRRLQLGKSTVHRLLASLAASGVVRFDPPTQRYALGLGIMRLAAALLHGHNLASISLPHMRALRDTSGETVCLHVRVDDERVCIQQVESRHELFYRTPLGKRVPLYAGASGRILLAYQPAAEIDRILAAVPLDPIAPHTITDPAALRAELARARELGYAVSNEERVAGAASVSVPVRDHAGEVVAALSLFGPVMRLSLARLADLRPAVQQTAAQISIELGDPTSAATEPAPAAAR